MEKPQVVMTHEQKEQLRLEYFKVLGMGAPIAERENPDLFEWFIEKIETERSFLNKEITDKDILLSKKISELNEIRYGDETKKDFEPFEWTPLQIATYAINCPKEDKYFEEVAHMIERYADTKIWQELELPASGYHQCEHCGCQCECSDQPCSCCPQKP